MANQSVGCWKVSAFGDAKWSGSTSRYYQSFPEYSIIHSLMDYLVLLWILFLKIMMPFDVNIIGSGTVHGKLLLDEII